MQNIPVADAKPDDIKDLLGGALFQVRGLVFVHKYLTCFLQPQKRKLQP
jgi:hypothetical protein